jgi:hypothetical protein
MIKKGDNGSIVKLIQEKLGIIQDGDFGPNTEAKVIEFQKKNKLDADGIVGDSTLNALGVKLPKVLTPDSKVGISEIQYQSAAKLIGCKVAAIKSVDKVEASGNGFLPNGDVKILFEPHVFWRELVARGIDPNKHVIGNKDILYQRWKTGSYGSSNTQWSRMDRAIAIDKEAALKSASYGRFQIMGNNHKACGFKSVHEFVDSMKISEYTHLLAFISFVKTNRLDRHLIAENWASFARGYNGSGYKQNRYDVKLLEAFQYFS